MQTERFYRLIEDYLEGGLEPAEQSAFETAMEVDELLAREVELQRTEQLAFRRLEDHFEVVPPPVPGRTWLLSIFAGAILVGTHGVRTRSAEKGRHQSDEPEAIPHEG